MKKLILSATLGLSLCSSILADGESASAIAKKHAIARALELEAYLKKHPHAYDKDEAVTYLLKSYAMTENKERFLDLTQDKFDTLVASENLDIQSFYSTTNALFNLYLEDGNKEAAQKLLDTATQRSQEHQVAPQLISAFNQMAQKIKLPRKGETMNIKFTGLMGQDVDLATMKGKVVLVDFWSTECGPCLREIPHMVSMYEKYKDQGFSIISISLDRAADKEKLKGFIVDNKMPWPQHFDGKGWKSDLARKYGITVMPTTFLIGKDGTVVASNLRGKSLDTTVSQYLSE